VYEHYFILLLPALFALVGLGVAAVVRVAEQLFGARHSWRLLPIAVALALSAVGGAAAMQVLFNRAALNAQEGGSRLIGRGVPLGDLQRAVEMAAVPDADRWVIAREDLREPLRALATLSTDAATLTGQALVAGQSPEQAYLLVEGSGPASDFLEATMAQFLLSRQETPSPAAIFRVYEVPTDSLVASARQGLQVRRETMAGVEVLSIDFERTARVGQALVARLTWRVEDGWAPEARGSYRFFVHLVRDASAVLFAQEDGIGYPSSQWRSGDVVAAWLQVALPESLPEGEYSLRVGLYDLDTSQSLPFLAAGGRPEEDWLLFGPVQVVR
jgi:hypothetical protein